MAKRESIAALRRKLAASEAEMGRLKVRRGVLVKKLEVTDRQIAALTGGAPKKRTRKVATKTTRRVVRRRGKKKTLADYIAKALGKSKQGVRAKDIAQAVKKSQYPSKSKNLGQMVAVALSQDKRFERVSRGVYKLA